jgi:hypothetical protein
MTLTGCTITGNDSAGIGNEGGNSAVLTGWAISANKQRGAGTLNPSATNVTGNTSGSTGGIFNANGATVNLSNGSSVSGNTGGNCEGTGTYNGPGCAP